MLWLLLACTPDPKDSASLSPDVVVSIDTQQPIATVSERYLSFAVDSAQVVGGVFWNPDADAEEEEIAVEPFDFSSTRVRTLAAALAPATLRIGGTAADFIYYDLDGSTGGEPFGEYSLVLTTDQWEGVTSFAGDVGLDILFTVNAGPGPRGEDLGAWDATNAADFLAYTADRGDPVSVWEFGNEINGYALLHGFSLSPEDYAADLAAFRAVAEEHTPSARIAGPSSAFWPVLGEFNGFYDDFMPQGGALLDIVTWHYYPQQSARCPVQSRLAGPEVMLADEALDEVSIWAEEVEAAAATHAPDAAVWLGETGNAQCGGAPGVSDTFAGGFWWLDQLGLLATRGQQQVVRQTLAGSDYGLLDDVDFSPYPDYWLSVLWRRHMGQTVLSAPSPDSRLRTYAHCHPDGGVTLAVINRSEEDVVVSAGLGAAEAYVLTAPALDSRAVSLNGALLSLGAGDALPDLSGEATGSGAALFPAHSYGFLHSAEAPCP